MEPIDELPYQSYMSRQDKTRQVYSANTMPGHQHTEVSTHTCTHQTHLTA